LILGQDRLMLSGESRYAAPRAEQDSTRIVDLDAAVLTLDRVVPIISASVSWLIFAEDQIKGTNRDFSWGFFRGVHGLCRSIPALPLPFRNSVS